MALKVKVGKNVLRTKKKHLTLHNPRDSEQGCRETEHESAPHQLCKKIKKKKLIKPDLMQQMLQKGTKSNRKIYARLCHSKTNDTKDMNMTIQKLGIFFLPRQY